MIKMSKKIKVILDSLLIICCVFILNSIVDGNVLKTKGATLKGEEEVLKEGDKKDFFGNFSLGRRVKISAVGDIILQDEQIWSAHRKEENIYDFSSNFKYIQDFFKDSDIKYGTIEGVYGGEDIGYFGYPKYNGPDSMIDALRGAGFNMLNIATEHALDQGLYGFKSTLEKVNKEMTALGSNGYVIKKIKGIEIGFTSYTYESREGEINGNKIPKEASLNTFSYKNLQKDLEKMKLLVEEMKKEGADFIVFGMHWGLEYKSEPSKYQVEIAKALNEFGVDLILGSNPHVIQPIEEIEGEKGNKTLVAYSLGNFISNQRKETIGERKTSDGVLLEITLKKSRKGVIIDSLDYIPTWVYKIGREDKKSDYYILPVKETLESEESKNLSKEVLEELNKSLESTKEVIEKNFPLKLSK